MNFREIAGRARTDLSVSGWDQRQALALNVMKLLFP
jgi:hypothetical protein